MLGILTHIIQAIISILLVTALGFIISYFKLKIRVELVSAETNEATTIVKQIVQAAEEKGRAILKKATKEVFNKYDYAMVEAKKLLPNVDSNKIDLLIHYWLDELKK